MSNPIPKFHPREMVIIANSHKVKTIRGKRARIIGIGNSFDGPGVLYEVAVDGVAPAALAWEDSLMSIYPNGDHFAVVKTSVNLDVYSIIDTTGGFVSGTGIIADRTNADELCALLNTIHREAYLAGIAAGQASAGT